MSKSLQIQAKLTELLDCLAPVDNLINAHVASFFTKNLWPNMLPPLVLKELENMSHLSIFVSQYLNFLSDRTSPWSEACPNLHEFLVKSNCLSITSDTSCLTPVDKLKEKLWKIGHVASSPPKLKDFMSEKKKHEVECIVPLAENLSKLTGTLHAVDVGGGKGYLSTVLSSHCNLQVLALDSSLTNTSGANKLEKKMAKISRLDFTRCQRDTIYVSRETALNPLLEKHFQNTSNGAGILGLHTCGNLATTCCQLFVGQNSPWLVNIGCCYHLIDEEFDRHSFWNDLEVNVTGDYGFPVSAFLTEKKTKLGRNARMLAAHSLERLAQSGINERSAQSLFYRALLQVVVESARGHDVVEGQVGRLFKKCADFHQYIRRAIQKLQLNTNISDKDIDELWTKFAAEEDKLKVFFLLRIHFAPLVESVILLDRLLFIVEQGIPEAHLVPLFDPAVSPRSHAIVAWK